MINEKELVEHHVLREEERVPSHNSHSKLAKQLQAQVRGEVRFDAGTRALFATDASNYRQVPLGVVLPMDSEDVINAVAVCREHDVPIVSRGGGTALAGQTCNVAVVLDFSKFMNRVLDIDVEHRRARVQPGVILDTLRQQAMKHGLTFGPDPATHNHCTLGGMIGNNSCGIHSVLAEFYGPGPRMEDNLEELEVLTYDGLRLWVGPTAPAELEQMIAAGGRRGEIYRGLRELRDKYAPLIRERFPNIPRRVSGYNLPDLLPERGFHVARALVGTESTCVTVLEAVVTLVPALAERALLVLGYPSIYEAGDHIPEIRELKPVGCEGIDDMLIEFIKKKGTHASDLELLPEGGGWLLVEFGGETAEQAAERARAAMRALESKGDRPAMKLYTDKQQQAKMWEIRESGLGATAFVPGEPDTWPGWEDSAVPVDRVGEYLRDLRGLFNKYHFPNSLYGHLGQGCIHCRIAFKLTTPEGIAQYRQFTDEAADLVLRYGGSLSGEHGDGQARGRLLPKMYGEELMTAFREFKALWDPLDRMNPGKTAEAHARTADLRLGTTYPTWQPTTYFGYPEDGGSFSHAALRCVGIGKCRREEGGTMCPSYMVTHEEKHTTRGRAHLLFEMLKGEEIADHWKSEEVKEALELCLSCKGCKGDCPVNVDIATYKAEFLAHYYQGRLRPRQAYAFGLIHRWARLAALAPWLANFLTQTPGLRVIAKAIAGVVPERRIPRLASRTFQRQMRRQPHSDGNGPTVILWPDTFNNHFFPETLGAAAEVLAHAGWQIRVPQASLCCGRPLYDYGMLDAARRLWDKTLRVLDEEIRQGVPIVVAEPSCAAAFRDELPNLYPHNEQAQRLSRQVFTLGEFLTKHADGYRPPQLARRALVQAHCQHKAVIGLSGEETILSRMGLDYEVLDSGCCGMAGSFGFEPEKYAVSIAAGERVLLPAVREADPETLIIADGFSCREQISQTTTRKAHHLAEVLQMAIHAGHALSDKERQLLPRGDGA